MDGAFKATEFSLRPLHPLTSPRCKPSSALLPLQRYLRDAAVSDCNKAQAQDPGQLKACVRNSTARLEQGKALVVMEVRQAHIRVVGGRKGPGS